MLRGQARWRVVCIYERLVPSSHSRWRRILIASAGLFIVIGGIAGIKFWQITRLIAAGETMKKAGPPPEAVGSTIAEAVRWETRLDAVGTVAGVHSVTVSNDQPGIVMRMLFDSGAEVRRAQPLVELDASVERAQLASAKARRELARLTAQRARTLLASRAIAQAELDNDETALAAADSDVAGLEAQIDHKIVRAPFAGRAGIRAVNLGQYLPVGTMVTTVDSVSDVWIDFTLPQEQLPEVRVGTPVRVAVRGQPPEDGSISAIDPAIDPATRNIKLRASLRGHDSQLRSGMFVTVTVVLPATTEAVVVPATAIVHAPYGDSVFVIEDKPPGSPGMTTTPTGQRVRIARQQFVRVGQARGDFVAIREGIAAGQPIVSFGAFKLRNNAPIVVDNSVQPKPQLEPHPENR
jgi:membrane fusion protein (multidrug efflux system)